ncbi:MAG: 2-amino-4-hydroxy-6-hydroxymethyldihydropteridine diphosphokinase [Nocardioidaceae bacterium]
MTVSSVYETTAVEDADGSPDFLNVVVLADTTLSVALLLDRAHAVEAAFGRQRGDRHAPRTLDVDLIVVGDRLSDTAELTLPHPRAHERAFVLVPWNEVDPQAQIPGKGKVADLLADARPRRRCASPRSQARNVGSWPRSQSHLRAP